LARLILTANISNQYKWGIAYFHFSFTKAKRTNALADSATLFRLA